MRPELLDVEVQGGVLRVARWAGDGPVAIAAHGITGNAFGLNGTDTNGRDLTYDGNGSGNCIANNCCDEAAQCFSSPQCQQDAQCMGQCIAGGTGPIQCFFQCNPGPEAQQFLFCLGSNCGGACFGG